ncbi:response regulator [Thalassorhabdomicrobium marinisediminis]|uniref:Response regulatory domain-containing protein n=1 Tax=Thalassorhabdomicrobium marinisediminis TaxID=2170577 RepID=A0A2T7FYY5_9RHOB|nr:response regulator [Thalassorhabdomicrobium marinisediminis]PVA07375.1 hypothetical protein DC363_05895 [Thalassorhabdomicrobium marinisediminis]
MAAKEILVLEDEALIAIDIETTLADAGFNEITVHATAASALERIEQARPTAAFLDFNLGRDETSVDVAEKLKTLGVPFVFLTGYTEATVSLPDELDSAQRIEKPFQPNELITAAEDMLQTVK